MIRGALTILDTWVVQVREGTLSGFFFHFLLFRAYHLVMEQHSLLLVLAWHDVWGG